MCVCRFKQHRVSKKKRAENSRGKEEAFEPAQGGEVHIVAWDAFDHRIDLVGETGELGHHAHRERDHCSGVDAGRVPVEARGLVELTDVVPGGSSYEEEIGKKHYGKALGAIHWMQKPDSRLTASDRAKEGRGVAV